MRKDISTRQNQDFILMKERVKESPWTVMEYEEEEDVIYKSKIEEHDYVVIEDERIPYEECMHLAYQTIEEIGDCESLMLCSDQYKRRMP